MSLSRRNRAISPIVTVRRLDDSVPSDIEVTRTLDAGFNGPAFRSVLRDGKFVDWFVPSVQGRRWD